MIDVVCVICGERRSRGRVTVLGWLCVECTIWINESTDKVMAAIASIKRGERAYVPIDPAPERPQIAPGES